MEDFVPFFTRDEMDRWVFLGIIDRNVGHKTLEPVYVQGGGGEGGEEDGEEEKEKD